MTFRTFAQHVHVHVRGQGATDPQRGNQRRLRYVPLRTECERLVSYCHTTSASTTHALRIVLLTLPSVGRSYQRFPDGFDLHLPLKEWRWALFVLPT